ncbi:MAG: hypothetical protein IE916_07930 [Epsilonproteobacteria bacterium]|nr:hypothetical protein [Campylobacterota bacterium]
MIKISLFQEAERMHFCVQDDGRGFVEAKSDTLGLVLVKTLITKLLKGSFDLNTTNGTTITKSESICCCSIFIWAKTRTASSFTARWHAPLHISI